jgi:tRNA-binding protein
VSGPDDGVPVPPRLPEVSPDSFFAIDIRVGTVVTCEPFPQARRPAYRLSVDLGPLGVVRSSARLVDHYRPEDLVGTQVVCAANFPPRQIGPVRSEVLVLGVYQNGTERVVLLRADAPVRNGDRVG